MGWGGLSKQSKCQKKDQPTKPYTHPWGRESTPILNLQTELKYLDLFKCYNILTDLGGYPPLGMGEVGGWVCGWVWVYGGAPCKHICAYMHECMHICAFMLNMINMDASMEAAICNYYTCIV